MHLLLRHLGYSQHMNMRLITSLHVGKEKGIDIVAHCAEPIHSIVLLNENVLLGNAKLFLL